MNCESISRTSFFIPVFPIKPPTITHSLEFHLDPMFQCQHYRKNHRSIHHHRHVSDPRSLCCLYIKAFKTFERERERESWEWKHIRLEDVERREGKKTCEIPFDKIESKIHRSCRESGTNCTYSELEFISRRIEEIKGREFFFLSVIKGRELKRHVKFYK